MRLSCLAFTAVSLLLALPAAQAADKPVSPGQVAVRPPSAVTLAPPGQIVRLEIMPQQVASSVVTTATVFGSGHCKFTLDAGNGLTLKEEADLPAKLPLSYIVATQETTTFTAKVTGTDGCKGAASSQVVVGTPVPYNSGSPVKAPNPVMQQGGELKANP
jgi:hypothetical protein